jgi:hypothetical protein
LAFSGFQHDHDHEPRHWPVCRPPVDPKEEIGEGGRTAAAIGASQFGNALMVSEGGQLSFYQKGHFVWTL